MQRKLSEECYALARLCAEPGATFEHIVHAMGQHGNAFVSLLLALPFLQPIPLIGVSMVLGLIIAITGWRSFLMQDFYVPQRFLRKQIPGPMMARIFEMTAKLLVRLERFVKPRGQKFVQQTWVRVLNGLFICMHGLWLTLPLPPGAKIPSASAVALLSIATLANDSIALLLGYVLCLATGAVFFLLAELGEKGLVELWRWIS